VDFSLLAELSTLEWTGLGGGIGAAAIAAWVISQKSKTRKAPTHFADPHERLRYALTRKETSFLRRLRGAFQRKLDDEALIALEQILLEADVGVRTSESLMASLREGYKSGAIKTQEEVVAALKKDLKSRLGGDAPKMKLAESGPTVILMVGVNGVGKTTSISKLARYFAQQGKKVLLSASDTFRAAAVDQLALWAQRLDLEIVRGQEGQKPDAVAHDSAEKAVAKGFDVLIVDTAGRLHTDKNLMKELEKISRVLSKVVPGAPHETLLVIDANTGQNAVAQTDKFREACGVSGIVLTKLDGTPKGGIVVRIKDELSVPVKFVGLGEQPDDIAPFDAERFVDALFDS
jgi:fused signal recognition particle receptor